MIIENFVIQFATNMVANNLLINCNVQHIESNNKFTINNVMPTLKFKLAGKTPNDTIVENGTIVNDANFEILDIWVDGIRLELWALDNILAFVPDYDQSQIEYATQHNIELKKTITNQVKFSNNGEICVNLDNFYNQYNQNLLNSLRNFNHWVVNSHLGFYSEDDLNTLEQTYQFLCNTVKS